MKSKQTAKKSTPTKKSSGTTSTAPLSVNSNTSSSISKIENGYLITENWQKGTGRNQQWGSKQYFSATNPLEGISTKMSFGKKK